MLLVFGSINLDLVAIVETLPRGGETQTAKRFRQSPGGKGANQALAARLAGAEVALHGAVGRDAFAAPALSRLRESGVDLSGIVEADDPTGIALIHVDAAGENTITVVPGANARASQHTIADEDLGSRATVLVQLEVPVDEVVALFHRASARGARTILNAAPALPLSRDMLSQIDVLVVNVHEARAIAEHHRLPPSPLEFATALAGDERSVVVTCGGDGVVARSHRHSYQFAAPVIDVVDTIGAGDAFVGTLAACLERNAPIDASLRHAIAAGALACRHFGAQEAMPSRTEIEALALSVKPRSV